MEQGIINKQAKLSEHFTLGEMIKTNAKGIDNTPPHGAVVNLKNLCENWLEDLRYSYNLLYCLQPGEDYESSKNVEPIIINSGFRSEAVNKAVGGAKESNHLTGCAVDIKCFGIEQAIRYAAILLDIADGKKQEFDELLIERSPKGSYWLHFAVRPTLRQAQGPENRRKVRFIQT
jgi:uncharacterized protein YcbK (DUF882 family)